MDSNRDENGESRILPRPFLANPFQHHHVQRVGIPTDPFRRSVSFGQVASASREVQESPLANRVSHVPVRRVLRSASNDPFGAAVQFGGNSLRHGQTCAMHSLSLAVLVKIGSTLPSAPVCLPSGNARRCEVPRFWVILLPSHSGGLADAISREQICFDADAARRAAVMAKHDQTRNPTAHVIVREISP